MNAVGIRVVPKSRDASVAPGMLAHLDDLEGFAVADPAPDVRNWEVVLPDGRRVGTVSDLIIDTTGLCARYLEVKLDRKVMLAERDTWTLVPLAAARLHRMREVVTIDRLPATGFAGASRGDGSVPTPEEERAVCAYFELDGPDAAANPMSP